MGKGRYKDRWLPTMEQWRNAQRIYKSAYENATMGNLPFIQDLGCGIVLDLFDNNLNNYYEKAKRVGAARGAAEMEKFK